MTPWSGIVPIVDAEGATEFATGLASVDDWFSTNARAEHVSGRMRTHCCLTSEHGLSAFFALKMITVTFQGTSNSVRKKFSDTEGSSTALLLAQMGVRADLQGKGFGKHTVLEALRVAAELHEQAAFRVVIVDAESDDLIPFYAQFGFSTLRGDRRMIMKMSAVHKLLERLDQS